MLRWILDLVILLIVLFCAWRGMRSGLIAGMLAACAVLFSFYAADILADTYSGEFTRMLEPFVSGVVDSAYSTAEKTLEPKGKTGNVYDMSLETVRNVGLMKSAAENVAKTVAENTRVTGNELRVAIVDRLCSVAAYVLTYAVMFILLIIIFAVIGNLFNLAFKLPGLELINSVLGFLLGAAKGLMYAFAIVWFLRFTGLLLPEATIDETRFLGRMMESCPLVDYLGL